MNNDIVLKAEGLCKTYDSGKIKTEVFNGIELEVPRGIMLTITGASGTGKSTLLHILGGMDNADSGRVIIDGECLQDMNERSKARLRNEKIGFIFQFFHLLPEFTALENVMIPALSNRRKTGNTTKDTIRDRALELLEQVGLSDRIKHKPSQLSGGQMQRVAFARAMINDPVVIFADEPTGNLDEQSSETFIELINAFNQQQNKTFVIATHNADLASRGQRTLHLTHGQLFTNQ